MAYFTQKNKNNPIMQSKHRVSNEMH